MCGDEPWLAPSADERGDALRHEPMDVDDVRVERADRAAHRERLGHEEARNLETKPG